MTSRELLTFLIKELVSNPDQVTVEEKHDDRGTLLVVNVAPEDRGTIIGKQGVNANAIRQILAIVGHKHGESIGMSIDPGREFSYGRP